MRAEERGRESREGDRERGADKKGSVTEGTRRSPGERQRGEGGGRKCRFSISML